VDRSGGAGDDEVKVLKKGPSIAEKKAATKRYRQLTLPFLVVVSSE